jgi:alpha-D-ribose 1-methylphosphonate 5-triphosphate synthase subunit PhnG
MSIQLDKQEIMSTGINEASTRKAALDALAGADGARLSARYEGLADRLPKAAPLRGPEIGMVMLRGRMGGGGALFNLGEATVTRATVRLESGEVGHAVVLGRDPARARIVALLDALFQCPDWGRRIEAEFVRPAIAEAAERRRRHVEETQATRVDFFTLARGED